MVSLVAQPAAPLAIFLQHQASKRVSSCRALCLALSQSASSVGGSSSEDDSLDSLGGGAVLLETCLMPLSLDGLDLLPGVRLGVCVLVCTEDLANAGEGVLSLRACLPIFAM